MRLLVWLILAAIVYLALRSRVRSMQHNLRNTAEFNPQSAVHKRSAAPVEDMVACAYCQIYLPSSDAFGGPAGSGSPYFCSEEHARLHRAATSTQPAAPHE